MIDFNNAPKVSGETATWKSKPAKLDDFKNTNQAWSGYGISDGEIIVFPTKEEYENAIANKKEVTRVRPTSPGSTRMTGLVLVERVKNGKSSTNWFNMSALSRPCRDAAGKRYYSTEFMENMANMADDSVRLSDLFGKAITGDGIEAAYQQKFNAERKPVYDENEDPVMEPYEYVKVDLCEVPAAESAPAPAAESTPAPARTRTSRTNAQA
jgi:hypothetical protein